MTNRAQARPRPCRDSRGQGDKKRVPSRRHSRENGARAGWRNRVHVPERRPPGPGRGPEPGAGDRGAARDGDPGPVYPEDRFPPERPVPEEGEEGSGESGPEAGPGTPGNRRPGDRSCGVSPAGWSALALFGSRFEDDDHRDDDAEPQDEQGPSGVLLALDEIDRQLGAEVATPNHVVTVSPGAAVHGPRGGGGSAGHRAGAWAVPGARRRGGPDLRGRHRAGGRRGGRPRLDGGGAG